MLPEAQQGEIRSTMTLWGTRGSRSSEPDTKKSKKSSGFRLFNICKPHDKKTTSMILKNYAIPMAAGQAPASELLVVGDIESGFFLNVEITIGFGGVQGFRYRGFFLSPFP